MDAAAPAAEEAPAEWAAMVEWVIGHRYPQGPITAAGCGADLTVAAAWDVYCPFSAWQPLSPHP